jgi:hypothetical protein
MGQINFIRDLIGETINFESLIEKIGILNDHI